jgi:hypothetical protein
LSDSSDSIALEKFEATRTEFIKFFRAHSNYTRQDLVKGLGWPPEKVDILLELLIDMGMAIPVKGPNGEVRYRFEEFSVAMRRKLAREAARLEAPTQVKGPPKDYIELLLKKGFL